MNKLYLCSLSLVLIAVYAILCDAHQAPPPPPPPAKPIKTVGKAEVYYFKSANKTAVKTNLPIYDRKTDGKLDTLGLQVRFEVNGEKVIAPGLVLLEFITQTFEPKFATSEGRYLTILVDDREIGAGEMRVVNTTKWPQGNHTEWVGTAITFDTFKRIAKAGKVMMRLGKIEIELKDVQLDPLRDMLRTIEP
ncbi:MAG TPA: hypothetical protein VGX92_10350 [Pyrinomonadaceae bacterium]|jgi:hypothetical protein|nr:hypothetical protein [Pyrinomonadaceae bacterium]